MTAVLLGFRARQHNTAGNGKYTSNEDGIKHTVKTSYLIHDKISLQNLKQDKASWQNLTEDEVKDS